MTEPTLFDSVDEAGEHADSSWMFDARRALAHIAATLPTFTTDDVWAFLDSSTATTHEPRALGAVIRNAHRAGLIHPTGGYIPSTRPECHGRPVRQWTRTVNP